MKNNNLVSYDIRQLDTYLYDGEWTVNTSYLLGKYRTKVDNERAFLNALHRLGISCRRGCCRVLWDGDIWVLEERKTMKPLFFAVPLA